MISSINNPIQGYCTGSEYSSQGHRSASFDAQLSDSTEDTVHISQEGFKLQKAAKDGHSGLNGEENLSPEEKREVDHLKQIDQEVKAHERAHMAAGAGLVTGGANYVYQRGPDGKMYAVGGEVKIDTSREKDPKATIRKMQQVRRAALAPSQPSGQDRSVAAKAGQIEAQARMKLSSQKADPAKDDAEQANGNPTNSARNPFEHQPDPAQTGGTINITV